MRQSLRIRALPDKLNFNDAVSAYLLHNWALQNSHVSEPFDLNDYKTDFSSYRLSRQFLIKRKFKPSLPKIETILLQSDTENKDTAMLVYREELKRQKSEFLNQHAQELEWFKNESDSNLLDNFVNSRNIKLTKRISDEYEKVFEILRSFFEVDDRWEAPNLTVGRIAEYLRDFEDGALNEVSNYYQEVQRKDYETIKEAYSQKKPMIIQTITFLHEKRLFSVEKLGPFTIDLIDHFKKLDAYYETAAKILTPSGRTKLTPRNEYIAETYQWIKGNLQPCYDPNGKKIAFIDSTADLFSSLYKIKSFEWKLMAREIPKMEFSRDVIERARSNFNRSQD